MSKKIIESSGELTGVEKYLLTMTPNVTLLKDVADGGTIKVSKWCRYIESKEDKDDVTILSILTEDNKVLSTNSETFYKSFSDIADLVADCEGEVPFVIEKFSGTSKAGRSFLNCCLAIN